MMHAQAPQTDSSDECVGLLEAILDDAAMLQQTPAFQQLEKTEAFQAVLTDEQELDNNHCNDHPNTAGCKALFQIAERDRQIMARTPEYQAMTRTPEYRTLAAHIANAQSAGCIAAATSLF